MLSKENLHHYQSRLIHQAASIPNMGLFMEPGLGKTATALSIIKESPAGRTLVIAPKRVAESVWYQECQKWKHLSDFRVALVMGTPAQRLSALYSDSDLFVINVENVAWLVEHWPSGLFDYLVIDESSRFKDPSTKRFKAIKKVLRSFKRRLILTGTPTPQGLGDLWSQVGILDMGERLETTLTKFRDRYMYAAERNRHTHVVYKWAVRPGLEQEITDKISDICFSLRAEDYLKLPPRTNLYHNIELDSSVMSKYKELKREMVSEIEGQTVTAVTAAALANKLLQFTSGTVYSEGGDVQVHETKIEYLESLVEENQHPTLVFYHYKTALQKLKDAFPDAQELGPDNMDDWRNGKIKIMLAHPQSGGIGLNLQCNAGELAHVVWYDLPWSSENYIQANARVYRQGQTKPVIIHHLVAKKTIDAHVVKVLEGKISTQDAIMDTLKMEE
jgi:SNF2 family DNA or RNA helicase